MGQRRPGRPVGNLPSPLTSFVGRRHELAEIRRRLGRSRLVTLTGAGGVGKTRLAMEVARESRRGFADGAWFADLAPVSTGAQVAQAVATALGVLDRSVRPAEEQLADHLADRELLVVLDNCEHLVDACAVLADRLLGGAPGLRLLATSREALGIGGEHVVVVPPLSLPDPQRPPPPEALGQYDAVVLLLDRAAAVAPGFRVTDENVPALVRLCAGLDGMPLAIELAAARLRTMAVEQIVDRLEDRFRLLTGGSRVARTRQRTLRALIDWSYELCPELERRLWARLSVFSGGFELPAVEAVCADDEVPEREVLGLMDGLVARSVLLVEGTGAGRPRFRMLETIRQYGWDRLDEQQATAPLRDRHRDHYLRAAEEIAAAWNGPGQPAGLAALRAEHDNLRAALEWSVARRAGTAAQRLVAALRYHWCADGFLSEGRRWLDQALSLDNDPTAERAGALWVAAWAALLQGDHAAALERLDECDRIGGDAATRAQVTCLRGTSALFHGRLDEAVERYGSAVAAFDAVGDSAGATFALFQLAITQAHQDDAAAAAATAERAVAMAETRGEQLFRSYALWALGFAAFVHGDWAGATARTRAGLALQRGFNDHVGAALMIELLAWIAASKGDAAEAGRLLGAVGSIWRAVGTSISAHGPYLARHHARCEQIVVESLRAERYRAALAEGRSWDLQQALVRALGERPEPPPSAADAVLTRREREIAELVAEGLTNRRIAATLTLSTRTVDGHVERILTKLGFGSRSQVAAWVAERKAAGAEDR
jgi:predicted ATPase/DNA-binding CsgD family transcriptional regulator